MKDIISSQCRYYVLLIFLLFSMYSSAQIHVATSGSDSNDGSAAAPLLTIQHAVDIAQPGDTIWVHGGRYVISERIKIPQKQTSETRRCYLWAAGDGEVIIDGSAMKHTTQNEFKMGRCIYVNHLANYWHFKGLTLCNAEDNGMKVEGSYNIIEQCVFRDNNDTGLQIGMYKDFAIEETKELPAGEPKYNPGYQYCRGNIVINCDAYNNADLRTYNGTDDGGDADGFACKLFPGPGTEFHGCRAWTNSDDNWDLYMVYHPVVIDSCWAYHAGYTLDGQAIGNGNGFKLGGGGSSGGAAFSQSVGAHVVKNCVAFGNLHKGFDQNNAYEGMYLFNNTAWGNEYNYRFPTVFMYGGMYIRNCIGFNATERNHEFLSADKEGSVVPNTDYNSWTTLDKCSPYKEGSKNADGVKAMTADYSQEFISLSVDDFMAPRQADGSLPANGFARLKDNSMMRDKGEAIVKFLPARFMSEDEANGLELVEADFVTIKYNDAAPDFGAFETAGVPADIDDTPVVKTTLVCVTANSSQEVVSGETIEDIVFEMKNALRYSVEGLPEGLQYSADESTIRIYGSPKASASYSVIAEGENNTSKLTGVITVVPPSYVLTGDWYHFQDAQDNLPDDIKNVITLVQGTDAERLSVINPEYTESGTVPGGCTKGALVMGRSGGGVKWNFANGIMKLLVNIHMTGGRTFKISWQKADGTSGSITTEKMSKGTYTSWDVLERAGLEPTDAAITITMTNTATGGEVRMYDMFARVPMPATGITTIERQHGAESDKAYTVTGQQVSGSYRGIVVRKGKAYIR